MSVLLVLGVFLIPMSIALFLTSWLDSRDAVTAIIKTCGLVVGMIPSGVYLLVTLTLTLSVLTSIKQYI